MNNMQMILEVEFLTVSFALALLRETQLFLELMMDHLM